MPTPDESVDSIQSSLEGLSIADVLARHPDLALRTAQRWLRELMATGRIMAIGEGRARRCLGVATSLSYANGQADEFSEFIPLSAV